ncbi:imidazole glycerol phosphate synthase subunit HisH [Azospirillum halopraeferens]|uniref:imidazole glycerol phosphate synthase subunit HisH n=1 Tax=Azospirillum halopraeferens TaxID=34010 RepID=UPI00048F215D|nr:imidazole glycerol phosphate synthase subunit HisH [Azospirillum halopraeferens]
MSSATVTVFDYGLGNLYSVCRALEHVGADVRLVDSPPAAGTVERLVVPGVGAFGDCVAGLRRRGMFDAVREHAATGRPFLGICVGMQMLFEVGEEFGEHEGLGLIPGRVAAISATGADGTPHRLPHIGWAPLVRPGGASWEGTPLAAVEPGESVYFVHSFQALPTHPDHCAAVYDYDGLPVTAAVRNGAVFGTQFHPERSGPVGLRILSRFLEL